MGLHHIYPLVWTTTPELTGAVDLKKDLTKVQIELAVLQDISNGFECHIKDVGTVVSDLYNELQQAAESRYMGLVTFSDDAPADGPSTDNHCYKRELTLSNQYVNHIKDAYGKFKIPGNLDVPETSLKAAYMAMYDTQLFKVTDHDENHQRMKVILVITDNPGKVTIDIEHEIENVPKYAPYTRLCEALRAVWWTQSNCPKTDEAHAMPFLTDPFNIKEKKEMKETDCWPNHTTSQCPNTSTNQPIPKLEDIISSAQELDFKFIFYTIQSDLSGASGGTIEPELIQDLSADSTFQLENYRWFRAHGQKTDPLVFNYNSKYKNQSEPSWSSSKQILSDFWNHVIVSKMKEKNIDAAHITGSVKCTNNPDEPRAISAPNGNGFKSFAKDIITQLTEWVDVKLCGSTQCEELKANCVTITKDVNASGIYNWVSSANADGETCASESDVSCTGDPKDLTEGTAVTVCKSGKYCAVNNNKGLCKPLPTNEQPCINPWPGHESDVRPFCLETECTVKSCKTNPQYCGYCGHDPPTWTPIITTTTTLAPTTAPTTVPTTAPTTVPTTPAPTTAPTTVPTTAPTTVPTTPAPTTAPTTVPTTPAPTTTPTVPPTAPTDTPEFSTTSIVTTSTVSGGVSYGVTIGAAVGGLAILAGGIVGGLMYKGYIDPPGASTLGDDISQVSGDDEDETRERFTNVNEDMFV